MKRSIIFKIKTFIHQNSYKFILFKRKKASIAIFGVRRGGTTYLADLINSNKLIRTVDQPLDYFPRDYYNKIQNFKRLQLLPKNFCQYFNLDELEIKNIKLYFEKLENGCFKRIDKRYFFYKNQNLYKFTNGAYVSDIFSKLTNSTNIHLLRHPISQSLSCIKNDWKTNYHPYLDSYSFHSKFLTTEQSELFKLVDRSGTKLQKNVINWIIHNLFILKFSNSKFITIYYEDIVLNFSKVQRTLSSYGISLDKKLRHKNSGSRHWSSEEAKKNIKSGHAKKNLEKYLTYVNKNELSHIQKILDVFKITNYKADNPYPNY